MAHPKVAEEIQKQSMGAPVTLLEVDARDLGEPDIIRLVPQSFRSAPALYTSITWKGFEWQPWPLEMEGFEYSGSGPLPTPRLRVGNINGIISAMTLENDDLVGVLVTRRRTWERFLDGAADADPNAELPPDTYRIERKAPSPYSVLVEFELASPIDHTGQQIPGRRVMANYCPWIYRRWNGTNFVYDQTSAACPYAVEGPGAYFDQNGNPVADPALDRCSKRLTTGCKPRFAPGVFPFGGFPGAGQFRL